MPWRRRGWRAAEPAPRRAGNSLLVVDRRRPPVAWSLVLPVAAAELVLLVATANRYGYHRDELYFRVAARHPAWGYDDQPALTPLARAGCSEWLFGEDPRGLRVVSAVAIALVVVLVALIARELGAGRAGQAVAALATAASGRGDGGRPSALDDDLRRARLGDGGATRDAASSAAATSGSGCSSASSSASGSRTSTSCCSCSARSRCGCLLDRRFGLARSPLAVGGRRARARALAAEPPLAGAPRLAAARARRQDRRRGSDRQPGAAAAAAVAADRAAPRAALDRRALVAPAPHRGATVSSARPRLPRPARGRASSTGGEAVLHDGPAARRCSAPEAVVAERRLAAGKTTRLALGARDRRLRGRRGCDHAAARARRRSCTRRRSPTINEDAIETIGWPALTATVASGLEPAAAGRARGRGRVHAATTARRARSHATAPRSAFRRAYSGPQRLLALRPSARRRRARSS